MKYACVLLCLILVVTIGFGERKKRNLWWKYVDENGNPSENRIYMPIFPDYIIQIPQNPHPKHYTNLRNAQLELCNYGYFSCTYIHQCIPNDRKCNGYVDCVDASDEINCPCYSRLPPRKLCDNYDDCPDGADEIGCFGCENDQYSCYRNESEYNEHGREVKCYIRNEKCDGFMNCPTHKDESKCIIILDKVTLPSGLATESTEGILHRYYQGKLYPVCGPVAHALNIYSILACHLQIKTLKPDAKISMVSEESSYNGTFVTTVMIDQIIHIELVNKCSRAEFGSSNTVLRVKCPELCGDQIKPDEERSFRIAGGSTADKGSNPWLIGLFVNGTFVCGGSVITKDLIITAAHCLCVGRKCRGKYDYVEVRAGVLRQQSFSSHEQAIRVKWGFIHSSYDRETFKNDVALLKLENPLIFNSWVQPICLPTSERVGKIGNLSWIWGPDNFTTCKIAGWGGRTNRGPFPVGDQEEAYINIVDLRERNDDGDVLYAGSETGGTDTCIGDSGGPLVCTSKNNDDQVYLAGVTSSGYNTVKKGDYNCGERDTFGTYTSMSWYTLWIEGESNKTKYIYRKVCPGVMCSPLNHCAVKNGVVDCLNGEDEI